MAFPAISHVASQTNIFVRHGTPGTSVADTDSSIRIRIQDFEDQKREHPTIQKIKFTNFSPILWVIFDLLDPDPIRIRIRNTAVNWIILPHSTS
jgi:hypothetical protein